MTKGKKKGRKGRAVVSYDSDDERAYAGERVPDKNADDFYHDEVDEFHDNRDKILLDSGTSLQPAPFSSDEEEVLPVGDDDDSEDEEIAEYEERLRQLRRQGIKKKMGSDEEEEEDEEAGLPDEKAWGKKRSMYYSADVDDSDDMEGSDEEVALEEEKEALAIQKKMAEQLDDQDFGLDIFQGLKKAAEEKKEKKESVVQKDLSKLTKKEKLQLLQKQSPELLEMIQDFKLKMSELHETLLPVYKLVRAEYLPPSKGTEYVTTKVKLCLDYCINVTFYLMLKAKQTPIHNHPVITRLLQYRNLFKQLESVDADMAPKLKGILEKVKAGEPLVVGEKAKKKKTSEKKKKSVRIEDKGESEKKKRKLSQLLDQSDEEDDNEAPVGGRTWGRKRSQPDGRYETEAEMAALENYEMLKGGRKKSRADVELEEAEDREDAEAEELGSRLEDDAMPGGYEEEFEEGDKRGITYEMAKNKGLTPKRKKEYRNPRVKHRLKYRKAKIRRKGQIREVRTEVARYGGEMSGIRAGIKRGIKLK